MDEQNNKNPLDKVAPSSLSFFPNSHEGENRESDWFILTTETNDVFVTPQAQGLDSDNDCACE